MKRLVLAVAVVAAIAALLGAVDVGCATTGTPTETDTHTQAASAIADDSSFARAYADRAAGLEIEGHGTVSKLLTDDTDGARHQRFIVRLDSGQTLLLTHNIDVAPRISALRVGDTVSFKGEYEWNAQGGVIHWTHHDPTGGHVAGWIKHDGQTYQ